MHEQNYQYILNRVQTPTRYSGSEINTVKKDLSQVDLTFALAFPDLYEIGTSHFGLQILYSILNNREDIAAERFFAPAPDMEALMRERKVPCLSMESRIPLNQFDVIGVSLLYELNFTNILTLFDLSGIPFYAEQRDESFPLIIAGGPCAFNPEPLADFFDAFIIGDGEESITQVADTVIRFKKEGDGKKKTLLRMLSQIEGVYVPSFFTVSRDGADHQILTPLYEDHARIKRAIVPELTFADFPISPIVPFGKPVHDRLRLEIARGCSRGCRFCQAGMIYRPVRERSLEDLLKITKTSLETTGYSDISLLSLSTGDYSQLAALMEELLHLSQDQCNAISLPSIRAEKLTPQLMELIKSVRKTGFTIAPEAGTQRLRDIINKNLTEESIEKTVENALALGWKNIKLYFMTGLPFEQMDDIQGIADLTRRLASTYTKGKQMINASVTCFIPKAHTPFQNHAQMTLEQTLEKLQYLKDNLRHPKVKLKWQDPKMSLLEGVWARGDRRLSPLLVKAFGLGCRLDGWSDRFNFSLWEQAFEATAIDPAFYTTRPRTPGEPLPWDHIDAGIKKEFLESESKKAEEMALTPDCRENACTGCGICNFKTIAPVVQKSSAVQEPLSDKTAHKRIKAQADRLPDDAFIKYELKFSKLEDARFFGHLEMATIFQRAVKRTGFAVKYSKGFNPSMRMSFATALPLGMESEEELLYIYLEKGLKPHKIMKSLNAQLPRGIEITNCGLFRKSPENQSTQDTYQITFATPCIGQPELDRFLALPEFMVEDISKKGKIRKTDLRKALSSVRMISPVCLEVTLTPYNARIVRPAELLGNGFGVDDTVLKDARIKKIKS
ncbi:TIGR03960 family B12-binding radical SAM protein [uncultured Desulfobacter sp.]|uniref:TIGR03960 family B12-binding radical SAM protein n=1 Tax=uncultured Desulfobacter sp. TaxID=240139 RepID=UPI002AA7E0D6|nr:TIGR03960 family B12-binding radical SAM protein [uncultured Desulfobacter sp.]